MWFLYIPAVEGLYATSYVTSCGKTESGDDGTATTNTEYVFGGPFDS